MANNGGLQNNTVVVILAAGKSVRMGRADLGKVCFEIDGVPAINRTIRTFKEQGFARFLLVVGTHAEQVMGIVGAEHPGVMYAYQEPQLGTGHAAKVAAEALRNVNFDGTVLVTMGDKYLEGAAVAALVDGFVKQQADMALLTVPKRRGASASGRVVLDDSGQAIDIVEKTDLSKQSLVDEIADRLEKRTPISGDALSRMIAKHVPEPRKQAVAVPELLELAKAGKKRLNRKALGDLIASDDYTLTVDGEPYTARRIEASCKGLNPSLYLFRSEAFYSGVDKIENDNAQREYYLTDIVKELSFQAGPSGGRRFRVRVVPIDSSDWIQGFNSPDELLSIQDYVRRKRLRETSVRVTPRRPRLQANRYGTVRKWLDKLDDPSRTLTRWLSRTYGPNDSLHARKIRELRRVLKRFGKQYGYDEKVCIVRVPGRANLMGRHVDHHGGFNNFLAIDRETIAVAAVREDDEVHALHLQPGMGKRVRFSIGALLGQFAWSDWIDFPNSERISRILHESGGDWGNYITAAVLRLQHQYQDVKVRGMNLAFSGTVPIGAGLSSSATIVVATLQAAIALNDFEVESRQFIDLWGEGEWITRARGEAGAGVVPESIIERGKIAHVGYQPFIVHQIIDAPADYRVLIADSHVSGMRGTQAAHVFSTRMASYDLGLALLRHRCPEIEERVHAIRDLDPSRLGLQASDLYRMLLKIPRYMTRREFLTSLPKSLRDEVQRRFAGHPDPRRYDVRGVLLFGAAEVMRSRIAADLLGEGDVRTLGSLMLVSHEGDRVSRLAPDGHRHLFEADCSDQALHACIGDLQSEDPAKVRRGQLYMQPGHYGCSTPEIDAMVDIAADVPGVAGAQIAGPGLGGHIMVYAHSDSIARIRRALTKQYYKPKGLKPAMIVCEAAAGAGLAQF